MNFVPLKCIKAPVAPTELIIRWKQQQQFFYDDQFLTISFVKEKFG